MSQSLLIYGAYGYTGRLIARLAVARGLTPTLAGRDEAQLAALARELALPHRAFDLKDAAQGLAGMTVVLHCAGPFERTSAPMVDACLARGVHYLDITGEIAVFEALAARDREALAAGVMLLPGAGFDVVPTDCMAAHLKRRLPDAVRLRLGFQSRGGVSRGTARTAVANMDKGGFVRRDGVLTQVGPAHRVRTIDFGRGPTLASTIPWGDVATAWRTTGIADIEVYMAMPRRFVWGSRVAGWLGPVMKSAPVQRFLNARISAGAAGPSDDARKRGDVRVWGEASNASGRTVTSRVQTPEGYTLTADAALTLALKALAGQAVPGYQTPAGAYGPDLLLGLAGVGGWLDEG